MFAGAEDVMSESSGAEARWPAAPQAPRMAAERIVAARSGVWIRIGAFIADHEPEKQTARKDLRAVKKQAGVRSARAAAETSAATATKSARACAARTAGTSARATRTAHHRLRLARQQTFALRA